MAIYQHSFREQLDQIDFSYSMNRDETVVQFCLVVFVFPKLLGNR